MPIPSIRKRDTRERVARDAPNPNLLRMLGKELRRTGTIRRSRRGIMVRRRMALMALVIVKPTLQMLDWNSIEAREPRMWDARSPTEPNTW